jgi:hypothetical protein
MPGGGGHWPVQPGGRGCCAQSWYCCCVVVVQDMSRTAEIYRPLERRVYVDEGGSEGLGGESAVGMRGRACLGPAGPGLSRATMMRADTALKRV